MPRLTDQHAAAKAKSMARMVKWWRARDRFGAAFDQAETGEIADALGRRVEGVIPARIALTNALLEGRVARDVALQLCFNRVTRETALMADAMGALKSAYFPPLEAVAS